MKEKAIKFALAGITTEEYAELPEHFPEPKQPQVGIKLRKGLLCNDEKRMIGMAAKFEFLNEDQVFLILEIVCHFKLDPAYWDSVKDVEANTITLDKGLLTHFLVLTVGTARGVLHAKKPRELYNLMLPAFDVSQEFEKNEVLPLSIDEEE